MEMKKSLRSYYRNRKKRIEYQRVYDKEHKKEKLLVDKKRRLTTKRREQKRAYGYSRRNHLPILKKEIGKCQVCNSIKNLEIHHKKYTKKLSDCMLLCQDCHKKIHRKFKQTKI